MQKLSTLVWVFIIVVASFMLYKEKDQVLTLKKQVAETERQLEAEKEALHVVAAEWAYLNRPERLQQLAARYLASSDVTVDQVADIQAIPFPGQSVASIDPDQSLKPVSARILREGMR